jgi:hypothetical protein
VPRPTTFHRYAYPTAIREEGTLQPFRTRDGAAFAELSAAIYAMGWQYGSLIFAYPDEGLELHRVRHETILKSEDFLVLTTRPPISDSSKGDLKQLPKSGTTLELAMFREFRGYFAKCARSHLRLTPEFGAKLQAGDFMFRQRDDARIISSKTLDATEWIRVPARIHKTLGFFLRHDRIAGHSCGLIACFGMGGLETLIWNRLVRTRYAAWLTGSRFVVGEFDITRIPEQPITLDFVDDVPVRLLVDRSLA